MAEILAPEVACAVEFLGIADGDGVAGFGPAKAEVEPSGKILSEVHNDGIADLADTLGLKGVHHLHVGTHGSAKGAQRNGHTFGFLPLGVVETRFRPVGKHFRGVIDFTVVFIVRADGTVGIDFPFLGRGNHFALAVDVFDDEVQAQFGVSEVGYLVGLLLLLHGVVATVAKNKTKTSFPQVSLCLFHLLRHIVGIIENGFAVVGGCWCQHVVAHLLSVDESLVHAQSAHVERGLADVF